MDELFATVEQLAPARALKSSFIAYPVVNALHIAAVGLLLTSVVLMDLRILGAFRYVPRGGFVSLLRRAALTGFAGAAATGLLLFSVRAGDYAAMPIFQAKLALIIAAGVNFLAFLRLAPADPDKPAGTAASVLALLSMVLWISVLFAGRFVGFVA